MTNQLWQAFGLLYRYPAFGRLWVGRSVSLVGDAFALIALPWFALKTTGSGTATAGVLLALQLPAILTSLILGSLIDHFQPRTIIAIDNGIRTLIVGLIPILYWSGLLKLWLLFLLTFRPACDSEDRPIPYQHGARPGDPALRLRCWAEPACRRQA